nr:MAG TPA: hypothetical protein [Caudoviricetes sp.]
MIILHSRFAPDVCLNDLVRRQAPKLNLKIFLFLKAGQLLSDPSRKNRFFRVQNYYGLRLQAFIKRLLYYLSNLYYQSIFSPIYQRLNFFSSSIEKLNIWPLFNLNVDVERSK